MKVVALLLALCASSASSTEEVELERGRPNPAITCRGHCQLVHQGNQANIDSCIDKVCQKEQEGGSRLRGTANLSLLPRDDLSNDQFLNCQFVCYHRARTNEELNRCLDHCSRGTANLSLPRDDTANLSLLPRDDLSNDQFLNCQFVCYHRARTNEELNRCLDHCSRGTANLSLPRDDHSNDLSFTEYEEDSALDDIEVDNKEGSVVDDARNLVSQSDYNDNDGFQ